MRLGHEQGSTHPSTRSGRTSWTSPVGRCFPGATVTEVDGDDFVGNIRSRLGPLTVWFDGNGTLTERDERPPGAGSRPPATSATASARRRSTSPSRSLARRGHTPRNGPRRAPR